MCYVRHPQLNFVDCSVNIYYNFTNIYIQRRYQLSFVNYLASSSLYSIQNYINLIMDRSYEFDLSCTYIRILVKVT